MSALLHSHSVPAHRPQLYVMPPVSDHPKRVSAEVYRRRRIAAIGIAVLFAVTVWVIAQSIIGVLVREETTQPMQIIRATQPIAADQYYTVRPGDTLWSIAQAVHPKGDFRTVLKRLDDRYGSTPLVAGQNILVS